MKKSFFLSTGILMAISIVFAFSAAEAALVDVTYTADNVVNSWYSFSGGILSHYTAGANAADWRNADTAALNLTPHVEYELIWELENSGTGSSGNPAGFLAEISSTYPLSGSLLSGGSWEVALFSDSSSGDPTTIADAAWIPATVWALNSDADSIWDNNNSNQPIAGISGDAGWIWTENNFDSDTDNHIFVRNAITVVPIPGAAWLLGAGIIGLVGIRRKYKS